MKWKVGVVDNSWFDVVFERLSTYGSNIEIVWRIARLDKRKWLVNIARRAENYAEKAANYSQINETYRLINYGSL